MSPGPVATLEEKERKKSCKKTNCFCKPIWIWPRKIETKSTKIEKPTKFEKPLEKGKNVREGWCGTTYKAMFETGFIVEKKEFERHMQAVESIRHENVIALMAYWSSEDEKWIVYDHYSEGSVSSLLHASWSKARISLTWENRIKIAIGAARGIAYLHEISSSAHGNIKSSNIFLNSMQYGCVSGMAAIMLPSVREVQPAGYRAPEATSTGIIHQPADVYSFGVLLLELLTGRIPFKPFPGNSKGICLVSWVQSVVREEWTAEVFDLDLLKDSKRNEEEMAKMLRIGMRCVASLPVERPKMRDVVALLEDIRAIN